MNEDIFKRALSDIMAYQATLWRKVTGEDAADDDIQVASSIWLDDLIRSLCENSMQTDFSPIPNYDFYQNVVAKWHEA